MEQAIDERRRDRAALRQASYARNKAAATRENGRIPWQQAVTLRRDTSCDMVILDELHEERIDMADLVTEMRLVKPPYKAGVIAQHGVEF